MQPPRKRLIKKLAPGHTGDASCGCPGGCGQATSLSLVKELSPPWRDEYRRWAEKLLAEPVSLKEKEVVAPYSSLAKYEPVGLLEPHTRDVKPSGIRVYVDTDYLKSVVERVSAATYSYPWISTILAIAVSLITAFSVEWVLLEWLNAPRIIAYPVSLFTSLYTTFRVLIACDSKGLR